MLENMGFTISEEQVFELVKTMDENTDGRISYHEMRDYLLSLGFELNEIEGEANQMQKYSSKRGKDAKETKQITEHRWRDKALELLIKTVEAKLKNKVFT